VVPKNGPKNPQVQRWIGLVESLHVSIPHVVSFWDAYDEFVSIRISLSGDGSILGVVKRFASDGGLEVCFGAGSDVCGALIALDRSIQGGNWRSDVPYEDRKKRK